MAALAALLFIIAWNMSEARHFIHTMRSAPPGDVAILIICFALTVLFDMVLAVAVGMGLAAALFIRRMALLTTTDRVDTENNPIINELPTDVAVYEINGPLFFGVAEKAVTSLRLVDRNVKIVLIDMRNVPSMDGTAIVALQSLIDEMHREGIALILVGLPSRIIVKLRRSGIRKDKGVLIYCKGLQQARDVALRWHRERSKLGLSD